MSVVYRRAIKALDKVVPTKMQPWWNHEAGPKTIHFWAPAFKWGLVIASIADLQRPVEKLSQNTNISLAATGAIWARYSLTIKPKNWLLFSVNIFVFITNAMQLGRIYLYHQALKNKDESVATSSELSQG